MLPGGPTIHQVNATVPRLRRRSPPSKAAPSVGSVRAILAYTALPGDPEVGRPLADGRVQGRLDPTGDQAHQVDELGGQEVAGVLADGMLGEQVVHGLGREGVLERRTGHDADRGFGREPIEHVAEEHGRPSVSGRSALTTNRLRQTAGMYTGMAREGKGCRIRVSGLPVKAPWRNPIEPKWMQHGKRAIVEPDRKLTADEVRERVFRHFEVEPTGPLK